MVNRGTLLKGTLLHHQNTSRSLSMPLSDQAFSPSLTSPLHPLQYTHPRSPHCIHILTRTCLRGRTSHPSSHKHTLRHVPHPSPAHAHLTRLTTQAHSPTRTPLISRASTTHHYRQHIPPQLSHRLPCVCFISGLETTSVRIFHQFTDSLVLPRPNATHSTDSTPKPNMNNRSKPQIFWVQNRNFHAA